MGMRLPEQGEKITLENGMEASANYFTTQEMLTIYMSLGTTRRDLVEARRSSPREERESFRELIRNVDGIALKIKKTFENLGVDIERGFSVDEINF